MNYNLRVLLIVLTLPIIVCVAIIIFSTDYAHFQSQGDRESQDIYRQRSELRGAFRSVYEKLITAENIWTNGSDVWVRPEGIRKSLSRGLAECGELPQWVSPENVYVRTNDVRLNSGAMICFVMLGNGRFPYGLDSTGGCRYARLNEVKRDDFVPIARRQ